MVMIEIRINTNIYIYISYGNFAWKHAPVYEIPMKYNRVTYIPSMPPMATIVKFRAVDWRKTLSMSEAQVSYSSFHEMVSDK